MLFLVLTVLASTINHLLFRAFPKWRVDLLSALVSNYLVCAIIGQIAVNQAVFQWHTVTKPWFCFGILQGAVLASSFFLVGRTTEKHGVSATSLASRLSVAVPTAAAFFLYGDAISPVKVTGIFAALLALGLSCRDWKTDGAGLLRSRGVLPLAVFLLFGVHFTLAKFVQNRYLDDNAYHAYVMVGFIAAFGFSLFVLLGRALKKQQRLGLRDVLSGAVLGISNYSSFYFLIRTLSVPGWESSQIFPTVSISVVALSALGARLLFGEKLGRPMVWALAVGAVAILLVNL